MTKLFYLKDIYYDECHVNFNDFINMLGYKYIETNQICYDYQGDKRLYFGKLYKDETVYYFNIEDRKLGSYYDVQFKSIFAEKFEKGNREDVFLSEWTSSSYIFIDNILYVNICALVYLFDDMNYMTKVDIDNNEVVIKRYNKADFEKRVSEKYNVIAYSVCNGGNEAYYKDIASGYAIYSGLNFYNAKEKCKKILENVAKVIVEDINLKYDNSLGIFIATANGKVINNGDRVVFSQDYDKMKPKLIIRAFDGMVLYPY